MTRYLTKSRFSLALQCPTKLYYQTNSDLYANTTINNEFLQALAEGGFQVGALARAYHPEGILIDEIEITEAAAKTQQLLEQEDVTLFEATFIYNNYCIRADILRKTGNHIQLIEVKAKSARSDTEFTGRKGYLLNNWEKYVYDVAFQKYVVTHAMPAYTVSAYLMLVNKSQVATVDGLNQKFVLTREHGRTLVVAKGDISANALGAPILIRKNVDDIIDRIYAGTHQANAPLVTFESMISEWAAAHQENRRIMNPISGGCGSCEFKADDEQKKEGKKSGFEECWIEQANFSPGDFRKPSVLKIWRYMRKDEAIASGRYLQEQFSDTDFTDNAVANVNEPGWSPAERQALQVRKARENDNLHELDRDVMLHYTRQWRFPLHMIDFETTAVAIPFYSGRRPYEQVAFQFSHHVIEENGTVSHKGQWINTQPGHFPNFDFIRALKKELETDEGTIFRYSPHENTILNLIKRQLEASSQDDRDELIAFIKTITYNSGDSVDQWTGEREMVDLLEVVKKCYYHPATDGSNSLKYVLPAVVNSSDYLKQKYSTPDYGITIPSLNFKGHQWLRADEDGKIINPYKTLPQIHAGIDNELLDEIQFSESREIVDGGAAMTAYARMQFTEMTDGERERITNALLRYCELDTLAMVMLYEAWREWCR